MIKNVINYLKNEGIKIKNRFNRQYARVNDEQKNYIINTLLGGYCIAWENDTNITITHNGNIEIFINRLG